MLISLHRYLFDRGYHCLGTLSLVLLPSFMSTDLGSCLRIPFYFGCLTYCHKWPTWEGPEPKSGWTIFWKPNGWNLCKVPEGEKIWLKEKDWLSRDTRPQNRTPMDARRD